MPQRNHHTYRQTYTSGQRDAGAGTRRACNSYAPRRRTHAKHAPRWGLLILGLVALAVCITVVFYFVQNAGGGVGSGPPWVVVLDAGHGGGDVGAEGIIRETELNEPTVARLYGLLAADERFAPVLTREAGEGATLKERVNVAKKNKASLFLSVHGNSSDMAEANGFECFPAPPGRTWHEESLRFASLLAGEMGSAGASLRGEGGVRYAYYDESDSKYFVEVSDEEVRKDETFGVLERSGCPAVLVEQCFITNEGDLSAFGGDAGCQRAAECYYRAICSYFEGAGADGE